MIKCPCCGSNTIDDSMSGGDPDFIFGEICPVCFWQYDWVAQAHPDIAIGPNHGVSLNQAKINYKEFGACRREVLAYVRPPREDEL